jgi:hypothetical protein
MLTIFPLFGQKKQSLQTTVKLTPNIRLSECLGFEANIQLKFALSGKELLPDTTANGKRNDKSLRVSVAYTVFAEGEKVFSDYFSLRLDSMQKSTTTSFFVPYSVIKLGKGQYGITCQINYSGENFQLKQQDNTEKININIPDKISVRYTLKDIEIYGSDWDIRNPFNSSSIYPDVYFKTTLGGRLVHKSGVSKDVYYTISSYSTGDVIICKGDALNISLYDEDTIFDDLIGSYYIFADKAETQVKLKSARFNLEKSVSNR